MGVGIAAPFVHPLCRTQSPQHLNFLPPSCWQCLPRYYTTFVVKSAQLIYKDSSLSQHILRRCWRLVQPYWPTIFAVNPHAQIALASATFSPCPFPHACSSAQATTPLPSRATKTLPWISGCVRYTVLRKHTIRARFSRQLLKGGDGGTVGLDWFRGCQEDSSIPATAPILLVLHGLAGAAPALVACTHCVHASPAIQTDAVKER